MGIYIAGQLSPLCIPLIPLLGLSKSVSAAFSGVVFFGFPSLFTFAAIAVLGRDGFNYLKARAFALFKRYAPTDPISRTQHRIGVALFLIPLSIAWVTPYIAHLVPTVGDQEIKIAVVGDVILLISLLVLGGDFWEKLRRLFIYEPAPDQADADA